MSSLRRRDVIKESWSSLCVTGTVGLRPFELCRVKIFGYFYIILILFCYYTLIYYSIKYSDQVYSELEIISKSIKIRRIQIFLDVFILPLMIISSISTNVKIKNAFSSIHSLDKKFKLFNIKMNYNLFMAEDIIHIFGMMIFTILMGLTEYYSLINLESTYTFDLVWITNQLPQIVNSVAISTFVVMLIKVRRRYSMINNLIVELGYPKKNEARTIVSTEVNNVFKLKLLREMYESCDNIASRINEAYGFLLLMSLTLFFIAICAHLYVVYSTFGIQDDTVDFIVDSMWTCFYFGKIIYIVDACHSYAAEGKRASKVLQESRVDANHHLLKQENESFARQVGNRDIKINACDFFTIDYSLVTKVVLALAAYVFFLSQFSRAK